MMNRDVRRIIRFLMAMLVCGFGLWLLGGSNLFYKDPVAQTELFRKRLIERKYNLLDRVNQLEKESRKKNYDHLFGFGFGVYEGLLSRESQALFIYQKDSLRFWTDNHVPVENYLLKVCLDNRTVRLNNGWFLVVRKDEGNKSFIGLQLIKQEYPIHNRFLTDYFPVQLSIDPDVQVFNYETPNAYPVTDEDGKTLLWLHYPKKIPSFGWWALSIALLLGLIVSTLFLARSLFAILGKQLNPLAAFALVSLFLLGIRYFLTTEKFPSFLYASDFFSATLYGYSHRLPSLGDLMLHALVLLFLTDLFIRALAGTKEFGNFGKMPVGLTIPAFLLHLGLLYFLMDVSSSLVRDSIISFDTRNLLDLNLYSFGGWLIVALLGNAAIFLLKRTLSESSQTGYVIYSLTSVTGLAAIYFFLKPETYAFLILSAWVLLVPMLFWLLAMKGRVFEIILNALLVSFFSGYFFLQENASKEQIRSQLIIDKINRQEDPVAEFLFEEQKAKLLSDQETLLMLDPFKKDNTEFINRVEEKYFSGFWDRYEIRLMLIDSSNTIRGRSSTLLPAEANSIAERINSQNSFFSYYRDEPLSKSGINARIPITRIIAGNQKFNMDLLIQMESRLLTVDNGFPSLLMDAGKTAPKSTNQGEYSWAVYKFNRLKKQSGSFHYSTRPVELLSLYRLHNKQRFQWKGYYHYMSVINADEVICVSQRSPGALSELSGYSFLFAVISIYTLLIVLLRDGRSFRRLFNFTLRVRIQILPVTLVLFSMVLVVISTIYYLNKQYNDKNAANLNERMQSVLEELDQKVGSSSKNNMVSSVQLTTWLKRFSHLFYTDINWYDPLGNLLASSRPQIVEEGLLSAKMNPLAYSELAIERKYRYMNKEHIGRLNYLSSYAPVYNKKLELIGYLNLPYFARQGELEMEISTFIVTLINIYILLLVVTVLLTLYTSNLITFPLSLLQSKLGMVGLGRRNEPILWENQDEIGSLIREYNRMIAELNLSARKLAESERESAWRDMAKQVAHEIKNPLTPIKLQVQMLDRTFNERPEEFESRYKEFSKMLIEQIETLSNIAAEFSRFAAMPKPHFAACNLCEIVRDAVNLFDGTESVRIELSVPQEVIISGDREHLIRVFNNLIKNSIQAIPSEREGLIHIQLQTNEFEAIVQIKDNGIGISEEQQKFLFLPNFTTKSGGMGLGLSMTKNILESHGGSIALTESGPKGTIFIIHLPLFQSS